MSRTSVALQLSHGLSKLWPNIISSHCCLYIQKPEGIPFELMHRIPSLPPNNTKLLPPEQMQYIIEQGNGYPVFWDWGGIANEIHASWVHRSCLRRIFSSWGISQQVTNIYCPLSSLHFGPWWQAWWGWLFIAEGLYPATVPDSPWLRVMDWRLKQTSK